MATVPRPQRRASLAAARIADLGAFEAARSVLAVHRSGTVHRPSRAHRHGSFFFTVEDRAGRPVGFTHARA